MRLLCVYFQNTVEYYRIPSFEVMLRLPGTYSYGAGADVYDRLRSFSDKNCRLDSNTAYSR